MPEEETSGVRRWLVDIARWHPSPAEFDAAAALLPPHDRPAIYRYLLFNPQLTADPTTQILPNRCLILCPLATATITVTAL